MEMFHNIMVGLAGSEADTELIGYAAMVARVAGPGELQFVHALPTQPPHSELAAGPSHREVLEGMRQAVASHFGAATVSPAISCHVLPGERIDRLLEFAAEHETDLVLVGHRRERSGRRSLARRLAMKAPCSVWMAPEGSPATLGRVLAPIDFSDSAADALSVAAALAARGGARECFALHVYFNDAVTTYDEYAEVLRGKEEQAFARFVAPLDLHGVEVRPLFHEAPNVAHAVERVAGELGADLVVMGTRGRSRSAAVLLGSETEQTIMASRIPVLAVKHYGARLNLLQALFDKKFRHRGGFRHGVLADPPMPH